MTDSPSKHQRPETWNKAYWNFTREDWVDWFNSFRTFPIAEYNEHIGSVVDLYF